MCSQVSDGGDGVLVTYKRNAAIGTLCSLTTGGTTIHAVEQTAGDLEQAEVQKITLTVGDGAVYTLTDGATTTVAANAPRPHHHCRRTTHTTSTTAIAEATAVIGSHTLAAVTTAKEVAS